MSGVQHLPDGSIRMTWLLGRIELSRPTGRWRCEGGEWWEEQTAIVDVWHDGSRHPQPGTDRPYVTLRGDNAEMRRLIAGIGGVVVYDDTPKEVAEPPPKRRPSFLRRAYDAMRQARPARSV